MSLREEVRNLLLNEIDVLSKKGIKKLPIERDMSKKLNVSRVTLRSALADLENEGKIIRKQGRGTFINTNFQNMKVDLFRMKSYSELILDNNYALKVDSMNTKIVQVPRYIAEFGEFKDEKVLESSRIFYADNEISVICVDYLPLKYSRDIEALSYYGDSIFKYLYENYNIVLENGSMEFNAVNSLKISKTLGIGREKLPETFLEIKGIEYDKNHEVVMYTEEYVNTDVIKFSAIRRRVINYNRYGDEN